MPKLWERTVMLGWHISVYRQKDGGPSPATAQRWYIRLARCFKVALASAEPHATQATPSAQREQAAAVERLRAEVEALRRDVAAATAKAEEKQARSPRQRRSARLRKMIWSGLRALV